MAMELVTGKAGVPHISSEDIGAYQAAVSGTGVIQLQNYNGTFPEVTLQNANKVTVPPMMLLLDGRFVRITAAETVTIQSGSSGYKRRDLICIRYSRDSSSGVESVTLTAVRGTSTSGTPSTPSVSGSIIRGSSVATYPIASVDIDGITPKQPVMLVQKIPSTGDVLTQIDALSPQRSEVSVGGAWKSDPGLGGFTIHKTGDHVVFQGALRLVNGWDGKGTSLICNLASEFWPKKDQVFAMANRVGTVYVRSGGQFEVHGGDSAWTKWDYIPLNMISYWTD